MPSHAVRVIKDRVKSFEGLKITVLGLSYKPNVADDRESPTYKLLDSLRSEGAENVILFDPYFMDKSTVKSAEEALNGADVVILACPHREFLDLDYKKCSASIFFDGKNSVDPSALSESPPI